MNETSPHADVLLIGASRGLGLAIADEYVKRGSRVVATVRSAQRTELHDLHEGSVGHLEIEHIDINIPADIDALRGRLASRSFDLLFVNAGVANEASETIGDVSTEEFTRVMVTNALSPMRVVEGLSGLVASTGTIAVMSSGQGSVANNERGGFEVYRGTKAALNMFMRSYAARRGDDPRTLLLMAPGWVKTRLGGPDARLEISDSIPHLVDVIDAQRGHGGLQYLDYRGETVAW
jgi:NAD(P)-dependent dehydrogenase (short-subunit alcohol dehydrogenase family)